MTALTTTRTGWTRRLAAVLLVLQGLAGGAVPLAHASERLSAPAHIEGQRGAGCLALHDSLRCALCHYAGSQVTAHDVRIQAPAAPALERRPSDPRTAPRRRSDYRTSPPRAPPTSRS
ncbi:MAG TPA: hypothetical protein VM716_04135 [Gemmatimonadales bacterium]|nr:hypothetical protein [Gemmatimonadales bacterium]